MPGELPRTPARGSQWQSCRRRARCIRRSTAPSCEIAGADEESASSRWIEKPRYCVRSGVGLALETSAVSERRAEKTVRSNDTRVSTTSPELQEIRVLSPARRDPFDGWCNGADDVPHRLQTVVVVPRERLRIDLASDFDPFPFGKTPHGTWLESQCLTRDLV